MKRCKLIKAIGIFITGFILLGTPCSISAQHRDESWAQPVQGEYLKNAYKLDDKVYRSAQPSRKAFKQAKELGITNVLNLRKRHSDRSKTVGLDLNLHHVATEADDISEQDLIDSLRIIKDAKGPVLVHCWHGSDRTGAVCAAYRIAFQGWSKQQALQELTEGGYGYHEIYKNIIDLINSLDLEAFKQKILAR